jgi:hypothetical protein
MHLCADPRALEKACGWKATTKLADGLADLLEIDRNPVPGVTA